MSHMEMLPESWDVERDSAFFRITASLFGGAFTAGAGVLLASYDDEVGPLADEPTPAVVAFPRRRTCSNTWV